MNIDSAAQKLINELTAKNAELEKKVENLSAIFRASEDGIIAIDKGFLITSFNDAAIKLFKDTTGKELKIGGNIFDYISEEKKEIYHLVYSEVLKGNTISQTYSLKNDIVNYDLSVTFYPLFSDEYNIIGLSIFYRNIADKLQDENKIIEQETLLDQANDAIIVLNLDSTIRYWNKSAERLFGWTAEEVIGKNSGTLFYPEPRPDLKEELIKYGKWTKELEKLTKSGSKVFVESKTTLITNSDGRPTSVLIVNTDINEKKRIEHELNENKRFLESVLTSTPNLIYIYDLYQKKNIYTNNRFREILGFSEKEIEEMGSEIVRLMVHPDDLSKVVATLNKISEEPSDKVYSTEYRLKNKSGEWRWVYDNEIVFKRNQAGKPVEVIGSIIDITQQKELELKLSESESFLEESQKVAHIGSFEFFTDTGKITWSEETYRIHGLFPGSVEPDYEFFISLIHPADRDKLIKAINNMIAGKSSISLNYRILRPDKKVRFVNSRGKVITDENNNPLKVIGTVQDITDKQAAEMSLVESEFFKKAILQSIPYNLAVINNEGLIKEVNKPWTIFNTGKENEELKIYENNNFLNLLRNSIGQFADPAKELLNGLNDVLNNEKISFSMEYSNTVNFKQQWFLVNIFHLNTEEGGAVIIQIDITDRKQIEKELIQSQKLEAIGGLAAGIAHDFNNLLTVIIGAANLAMLKKAKTDISAELEQINQASLRASNLTKQLLLFSRRQASVPRLFDLNQLIISLNKMLHRIIGEHIEFQAVLFPTPCIIKADPVQIEQVIVNMVINARDAMGEKGKLIIQTCSDVNPVIRVSRQENELIMLKITDNGIGIAEDIKQHIFEPFFTTKAVGKGTGLGLATSYGIITSLGGKIEVDSEPGRTIFTIYFNKAAEFEVSEERATGKDKKDLPCGNATILLVEDEPMVLKIASEILTKHGYKVFEALHAEDAIITSRKELENIDMLITDMVMPYMTGREVSDFIRNEKPDLKVLFMSGYTDDTAVKGHLEEGTDFLQKPFSPEALLTKVNNLLNKNK